MFSSLIEIMASTKYWRCTTRRIFVLIQWYWLTPHCGWMPQWVVQAVLFSLLIHCFATGFLHQKRVYEHQGNNSCEYISPLTSPHPWNYWTHSCWETQAGKRARALVVRWRKRHTTLPEMFLSKVRSLCNKLEELQLHFIFLPFCASQKSGIVYLYRTLPAAGRLPTFQSRSRHRSLSRNERWRYLFTLIMAGVMMWQWFYSIVLLIQNLFSWAVNPSTPPVCSRSSYCLVFTFHTRPTCRSHSTSSLISYCLWKPGLFSYCPLWLYQR